ncbi:MAG: putative immunity protein [Beijerinckiaceae bacterium]
MLHTTLRLLRRFNACGQTKPDGSYNKLRASLPADLTDDAPITLLHILESNGIKDAIWALRATVEPTGKEMGREMACRAAERVLRIFEKHRPGDSRPRECIEAARAYGRNEITLEQLREKRAAADAAAAAAAATYSYTATAAAAAAAATAAAAAAATVAAAAAATYATDDAAAAAAAGSKEELEAQANDYRELLAQF